MVRVNVFDGCRGSSPLTRGKPRHHRRDTRTRGLIPAHAGKTGQRVGHAADNRAHPRSRGENIGPIVSQVSDVGSSPLTRGKPPAHAAITPDLRLIPAHAGKTTRPHTRTRSQTAHPRSRGENFPRGESVQILRGSSPLTRGKHILTDPKVVEAGLIPAHAGKTPQPGRGGFSVAAHPRSRGENAFGGAGFSFDHGSSPLTRGKHPPGQDRGSGCGLIPAHAGKTCQRSAHRE